MKKRNTLNLFLILFSLLILSFTALARVDTEQNLAQTTGPDLFIFSGLEDNLKTLEGQELPPGMKQIFGNERINIEITLSSQEKLNLGLITENGKVSSLTTTAVENPTLNVYTTEETIQKIQQSENVVQALQDALDNKEITYSAVGWKSKLKFKFAFTFLRVASWFK